MRPPNAGDRDNVTGGATLSDERSRAIVQAMQHDEARHAAAAARQGAVPLPRPLQVWMKLNARVMTAVAYWI